MDKRYYPQWKENGLSFKNEGIRIMLMSEKITLVIAGWILLVLFITGDANLEIFFILIFIGVLIVRELTDVFTTVNLKDRMNIFIYLFILVFIVIVGKKIISVLAI